MIAKSAWGTRRISAVCRAALVLIALPFSAPGNAQDAGAPDWEIVLATSKANTAGGSLNRYSCTDAAGNGHGLYLNFSNARLTLERRDAWKGKALATAPGALPGGMALGEWYTLRLARAGDQLTASAYAGLVDPASAAPLLETSASDASHGPCTQFNINGGRDFDTDDVRVFVGGQLALADDFDDGDADGWATFRSGRIDVVADAAGAVLRKSGYNDPNGASRLLESAAYAPVADFGEDIIGRLDVREAGLKAISAKDIGAIFGLTEAQARGALAAGQVTVSNQGAPVPALADGAYGYLRFHGEALDSLYSLDNPYLLETGSGQAMSPLDATAGASAPTALVTAVTEIERDVFAGLVVADDPEADYWYELGFVGGDATYGQASIALPAPDAQAFESLTLRFKGAGETEHRIDVQLAGGEILGTATWSGFEDFELEVDLTSVPVSGEILTLELIASGGGGDFSYYDGATLIYARAPAVEDGALAFTARGQTTAITDFTSPRIRVLDLSDPAAPKALSGVEITPAATGYQARFATVAGNRYLAVDETGIAALAPAAEERAEFQAGEGYDYVVVTPPAEAVAETAEAPTLAEAAEALAEYRAGQGLGAAVVGLEEIAQRFGGGLATPQALSDFIAWAAANWGTRVLVLAGTSSYDYRNLLGNNDNLVPTLLAPTPGGLAACDGCLASDTGVLVGRIPAASGEELDAFRAKLSTYEDRALRRTDAFKLYMLADDAAAEGDFPADTETLLEILPRDGEDYAEQLSVTAFAVDPEDRSNAAGAAVTALNSGQDWANYIGHAGVTGLASEQLLTVAQIPALTSAQTPIVSALTCVVNRHEVTGFQSLGEALVMAPETGAVAMFGASGTSQNGVAVAFGRDLFSMLFDPADPSHGLPTLGEVIDEALMRNAANAPAFMLSIYKNLLGDPATLLHMLP